MSSHDKRISIERYPCYDDEGNLESVSFGCLNCGDSEFSDCMGYTDLDELFDDIKKQLKEQWLVKK
jgi:hypothetical protein